jgi:hypothetical protein
LASVKETVIDKLKSGVLPELKTDE